VARPVERRQESRFDAFVRAHGRKFTIVLLAIRYSAGLTGVGLVLAALTPEASSAIGTGLLAFNGAIGLCIGAYAGAQGAIEYKHAAMGTAEDRRHQPPPRRESGTIPADGSH
jgi:hypothetical protein